MDGMRCLLRKLDDVVFLCWLCCHDSPRPSLGTEHALGASPLCSFRSAFLALLLMLFASVKHGV